MVPVIDFTLQTLVLASGVLRGHRLGEVVLVSGRGGDMVERSRREELPKRFVEVAWSGGEVTEVRFRVVIVIACGSVRGGIISIVVGEAVVLFCASGVKILRPKIIFFSVFSLHLKSSILGPYAVKMTAPPLVRTQLSPRSLSHTHMSSIIRQ